MFNKIAGLLYDFLPKKKRRNARAIDMLMQLYPNASESILKRRYETERLQKILIILSAGSITAFILWIRGGSEGVLVNNHYILRAEQGEEEKTVLLTARRENGERIDTEITVRERRFQEEELEILYEDMLQTAGKMALGENESWDNIHKDLCLMQQIDGYPFILSWESGDYRYVTNSGKIARWQEAGDFAQLSKPVSLTLRAEYYDFVKEYIFYANICPVSVETFGEKAANLLRESEEENPYYDRVVLPEEIEGEKIIWTERTEHVSRNIFLLTLTGVFAVGILHDKELQKKVACRKAQIAGEYQAVISKLSLYLGAGMNLKGAWEKVAQDGMKNKPVNPVYEEMQFTCHEMEGGISEAEAYERFGKRIRLQRYIRLTTLLVQNLRKGNAALLFQLRQEAFLAMEEHAARIRRAGEEMGTKLLFPMLLMMGMIMVFIMVPAFLSF